MTTVCVLGAGGMLGHMLMRQLPAKVDVIGTVRGSPERYRAHPALAQAKLLGNVDAADIEAVRRVLDSTGPDVVINCVGIVKQRREARDPVASITVNSLFPHQVAAACHERGVRMLHVSTDCVFSGTRGRYREDDVPDAGDLYGRSKLLGEIGGTGSVTLRTSIIGRELSSHLGLVEWFLAQRGRPVRGFRRAIFSGLTTQELSRVILNVIENWPSLNGLYHVATDPINKCDLITRLNEAFGLGVTIEPDDAVVIDRSLDAERLKTAIGYRSPGWDEMVAELAADRLVYATADD